MKKLFCILLTAIIATLSFAETQQGIVKTRGRMDANGNIVSGERLDAVTVTIKNSSSYITNSKGTFSFTVPSQTFYIANVQKNGYQLCDNDVLNRGLQYSANPLVLVMETPDNTIADRLAAEKKIRRTLQRQLQENEDKIDALKEQQKITDEQYRKQLQALYADQEKNEILISEMAERYSTLDFDLMDEYQLQVAFFIQNGELTRADSLLNTKGSMEERSAEIDRLRSANRKEREEIEKRQANLIQSDSLASKLLEDFAADCFSRHEICKIKHKPDSAAYWLEVRAKKDTLNINWIIECASYYHTYLADYSKANELLYIALNSAKTKYADDFSILGTIYNSIGNNYLWLDDNNNALAYYQTSFEYIKETPEQLGLYYNNLALLYKSRTDYNSALEYLLKAEKYNIEYNMTKDLAVVYSNISNVYYDMGDYSKSYEYGNKCLELQSQLYSNKDQEMIGILHNLGKILQKTGNSRQALEKYEEALLIANENYTANHPSIATIKSNMAEVLGKLGEYQKELILNKEALEIKKAVYGSKHPITAISYINVGVSLKRLDNYEEALEYCKKSLNILLDYYGEKSQRVADGYSVIASLYSDMEDFDKSIEYNLKAIEIREEILSPNHDDLATSYNNIGIVYNKKGDNSKAFEFINKAVEILILKFGENHPNVAASYNNIGMICMKQKDFSSAMEYFQKSYNIAKELLGESHPNVAILLANIADVYDSLGKKEEAIETINKAYSIFVDKLGENHSKTKKILEKKIKIEN